MKSWKLLLTGCMLAACGGGDSGGSPTGPPGTNPSGNLPTTAQVQLRSVFDSYGNGDTHSFEPGSVTIARGGTVTWTNGSATTHNVTFAITGGPANIGDFSTGSQARTFPNTGNFSYSCTNHAGMSGTVQVQ